MDTACFTSWRLVMQELSMTPPYVLLWLRYSAFIVLYPVGVASELTMAWLAKPTIQRQRMWSVSMPNRANFAFDYYWCCIIVAAAYSVGLPQLYSYMLTQRKKVLGPSSSTKRKQA